MSVKNNKSVASQALLEMDSIVSAIKEESKKTLGTMLNEAVKAALRESVEDDDEEKDYEVVDDDEKEGAEDKEEKDSEGSSTSDVSEGGDDEIEGGQPEVGMGQGAPEAGADMAQDPQMGAQEAPEAGMGDEEQPAGEDGGANGWDEFSDYQVGDDTYDLTGENDYEKIAKVYKLLQDTDEVVVKQDGNTIQLKDGQAGTEYIIDLGGEGEEPQAAAEPMGSEETPQGELNEEDDNIAGFPGGDENFGSDFTDDGFDSDSLGGDNNMFESKKRKPMKESKQVLFEVDLGYTDNYQDKDPIKGLSNSEPSKSGKSWHKGVPTGTAKPWAGSSKDKSDPFEKTVDEGADCCPKCGGKKGECVCETEIDEANLSQSRWDDTHANHNRVPAANDDAHRRKGMQKTSKGTEYRATSSVNESKQLKAIKAENRELKKAIMELRKNLNEAYITNVNLGKVTKLFLENTTSKAEKVDIVNRFANEAKTVEQSKALYESISRELKKNNSNPMTITESSQTAKGTKELNENAGYKSPDVLKTIDFMNRVLNC